MLEQIAWVKRLFKQHAGIDEEQLDSMDTKAWIHIIKLFKNRIRNFQDLNVYSYLFQPPDFTTEKAEKSMHRVFTDANKSGEILSSISDRLEQQVTANKFTAEQIGEVVAKYLFENQKTVKNDEVYHILRFVVSGVHEGVPAADICCIIGKKETIKRLRAWI